MQAYVDDIVTVTEAEIREAMRRTIFATRLVPEPSGAVAVAAALFHREQLPPARQTVAIMTGGNVERGIAQRTGRMRDSPIRGAFCEGWGCSTPNPTLRNGSAKDGAPEHWLSRKGNKWLRSSVF
jgi:hypothetical protein